VRRVCPERLADEAAQAERDLPADLAGSPGCGTPRGRRSARRAIDFEDMLERTLRILETDADAAELVRGRYSWLSVDEYQDTNPLQEALLGAWLGGRDDLCVVGDPDQSIYSFSGATPAFLLDFARRHRGARVVDLRENFRSTPEVIDLANRLLAAWSTPSADRGRAAGGTAADGGSTRPRRARALVSDITPRGGRAVLGDGDLSLNAQVAEWEVLRGGAPFLVRGGFAHRGRAPGAGHPAGSRHRARAARWRRCPASLPVWAAPFRFDRAAPATKTAEAPGALGRSSRSPTAGRRAPTQHPSTLLAEVEQRQSSEDTGRQRRR
jgi:hypothetical protein